MQVIVITELTSDDLVTSVNEELTKHAADSIFDIKYSVSTYYSAMIILKSTEITEE